MILYKDDSFLVFAMIICLFFSVVFTIGIVFFVKKALESLRESIPVSIIFWCLTALCLAVMLFVSSIGLSSGITYIRVLRRDFTTIEGQVTLLSSEEAYHRDDLLGYYVVLSVDGEEFVPDIFFEEDIIEIFKSDRKLRIYYIESKGEIIVYEIRACD